MTKNSHPRSRLDEDVSDGFSSEEHDAQRRQLSRAREKRENTLANAGVVDMDGVYHDGNRRGSIDIDTRDQNNEDKMKELAFKKQMDDLR